MIIIIFLIEKKLMGNKLPDSKNKNDIKDSSNINKNSKKKWLIRMGIGVC